MTCPYCGYRAGVPSTFRHRSVSEPQHSDVAADVVVHHVGCPGKVPGEPPNGRESVIDVRDSLLDSVLAFSTPARAVNVSSSPVLSRVTRTMQTPRDSEG